MIFLIYVERMSDAIAISETTLNSNSSLNLNFPNYKFIRNDSITLGGGVDLYIKDLLRFTLRKDFYYFRSNLSLPKAKNIVISR